MARNKLVVPEARAALDKFKFEIGSELDLTNYNSVDYASLASKHTGYITKKLVEMGEKQLTNKK